MERPVALSSSLGSLIVPWVGEDLQSMLVCLAMSSVISSLHRLAVLFTNCSRLSITVVIMIYSLFRVPVSTGDRVLSLTVAEPEKHVIRGDVWFRFKTGYTNAVRKNVRVQDLM